MTSRFSGLQKRTDTDADAGKASAAQAEQARAVQIPRAHGAEAPEAAAVQVNNRTSDRVLDAKVRLHRKLIEELNLVALERLPVEDVRREIMGFVSEQVREERLALNVAELDSLVDDIVNEMVGLGPLEPIMRDPTISDVLINGHENCYVERSGKLVPIQIPFKDEAHLVRILNKIVAAVGRRIDESQPMCDARMLDGS
ncbi:MAG: ATPase, T2SS/T4P/T4SS family, partial [Rhizobiaceae bacterium]